MTTTGVSSGVRSAIATRVATSGLSCYEYDAWDIPSDLFVTLGAARWTLREHQDQAYGIRQMTIPVMLYALIDGDAEGSIAAQESALESILNALGADRTLGGKVAYTEPDAEVDQTYLRNPNGQTYSVVTLVLGVVPFSNTGA